LNPFPLLFPSVAFLFLTLSAALFHFLFHAEEAKKIVGCCVGDPWNANALISARATDSCHIENNFDLDALAAAIKTADESKHVVVIDSNGLVSTASLEGMFNVFGLIKISRRPGYPVVPFVPLVIYNFLDQECLPWTRALKAPSEHCTLEGISKAWYNWQKKKTVLANMMHEELAPAWSDIRDVFDNHAKEVQIAEWDMLKGIVAELEKGTFSNWVWSSLFCFFNSNCIFIVLRSSCATASEHSRSA